MSWSHIKTLNKTSLIFTETSVLCHFFKSDLSLSLSLGDIRNDLYLTLEKGDFERGGKSVQKNIEVTMYVLYADGEILKVKQILCPYKCKTRLFLS